MLLTSDFPSYELPGLDVKIPDRLLSRCMLDSGSGLMYGKLKQTVTFMLENQEKRSKEMKRNFNGHKKTLRHT